MPQNTPLLFLWLGLLRCPECGGSFQLSQNNGTQSILCKQCDTLYLFSNGMLQLIKSEKLKEIESFNALYDTLRLTEGWASETPGYYSELPYCDLTGQHTQEWKARARSFDFLQKWLNQNYRSRPIRILDVGAGSGWMSQRLGTRHQILAMDVNAGPHGLAAFPFEQRHFFALQAEMNHLPLTKRCIDLIITNASLHYLGDPLVFFKHAAQTLRQDGKLIVMDSPTYSNKNAATQAHERTTAYYEQMGVPELAQNYSGLISSHFENNEDVSFRCLRPDLSWSDWAKKWVREKLSQQVGARFPFWVGELKSK